MEKKQGILLLHLPSWTLSFTLVSVVFGVLLATGLRSPTAQSVGRVTSDRDISAATINRLETEQKNLKGEITRLQEEIEAYQKLSVSRKETLEDLSRDLDNQKMLAGVVPVIGDGVKVILDDSTKTPLPDDDPANYIIHEYQLRDVVNLLWQAGGEAMSINGERVINLTSIYCVGSTIIVNATRLSPPYEVIATGDIDTVYEFVNNPGVLRKFKSQARLYGLQFKIDKVNSAAIPAYSGAITLRNTSLGRKD